MIDNKKKRGLIGVTLVMFFILMMLDFLSTLTFLLRIEILSIQKFSNNAKAYYAARAGLEYAISNPSALVDPNADISPPSYDPLVDDPGFTYNIGNIGTLDLEFNVKVFRAKDTFFSDTVPSNSYLYDLNEIDGNAGHVYMISSTGWIKSGINEKTRKSIQCVYNSAAGKVIAWREMYRADNFKHQYLANHE